MALVLENIAQIIVGIGEVGFQSQSLLEGRRRVFQPALGVPCLAQVVLGGRVVGRQAYGLGDQFSPLGRIAVLAMEDAVKMNDHGVLRIIHENFRAEVLGLGQSPRLEMPYRRPQPAIFVHGFDRTQWRLLGKAPMMAATWCSPITSAGAAKSD